MKSSAASSIAAPPVVPKLSMPNSATANGATGTETTGSTLPTEKKKRKKRKPAHPLWVTENVPSKPMIDYIVNSMASSSDGMGKIVVRTHFVYCTGSLNSTSPLSSATLKLSAQPLPGKQLMMRSLSGQVKSSPSAMEASTVTEFDFQGKSVTLSMAIGDVRSKIFKDGACPIANIEFSYNGWNSSGALYLPALTSCSSEFLAIPLLSSEASSTKLEAIAVIEINPKSASRNNAEEALARAALQQLKEKQEQAKLDMSPLNITIEIDGILQSPQAVDKIEISPSLRLEASLRSSGRLDVMSLIDSVPFQYGLNINASLSLPSFSSSLDILELKLMKGSFLEDELGRVWIPVSCVTNPDMPLGKSSFSFNAFQSDSSSDPPKAFTLSSWNLVGRIYVDNLPSDDGPETTDELVILPKAATSDPIVDKSGGGTGTWTKEPGSPVRAGVEPNFAVKKPDTEVTSIGGVLNGCLHGFISSDCNSTKTLRKTDNISAELILYSEGLKKGTDPANPVKLQIGKGCDSSVEWGKTFSIRLAWALAQRQVSYMKISVYSEESGSSRRLLGFSVVDVASVVVLGSGPVSCVLPIRDKKQTCTITLPDASDTAQLRSIEDFQSSDNNSNLCGWCLVVFNFSTQDKFQVQEVKDKSSIIWSSILANPNSFGIGKVNDALINANASTNVSTNVKSLGNAPSSSSQTSSIVPAPTGSFAASSSLQPSQQRLNIPLCSVHVAVAPMQLTTAVANDIVTSGDAIFLQLGTDSSEMSSSGELIPGILQSGGYIGWDTIDISVKSPNHASISSTLMLKIFRGARAAKGLLRSVGESVIILPREELSLGLPLNVGVPIRNESGDRVAVLPISLHMTGSDMESLQQQKLTDGCTTSIKISFTEGTVVESTWKAKLEPFFECNLFPPTSQVGDISEYHARTNYLKMDESTDSQPWNLQCTVLIPESSPEAFVPPPPPLKTLTSSLQLRSSSFAVEQQQTSEGIDELNAPKWTLAVVCRDSNRDGFPVIGQAQIPIPWSFISRAREFESWLTLTTLRQQNAGRVRIKLNKFDNPGPDQMGGLDRSLSAQLSSSLSLSSSFIAKDIQNSFPGIGAVLWWIKDVTEPIAGREESMGVSLATAVTLSTVNNNSTGTQTSPPPRVPFAETLAINQLTHVPGLSIIKGIPSNANSSIFCGATPVPAGDSDIKLTVVTQGSRVPYSASFPVISTKSAYNASAPVPPIPQLELILSPDDEVNANNNNNNNNNAKKVPGRKTPKLKLEAAFVPFVKGCLRVSIGEISLNANASSRFINGMSRRITVRGVLNPLSFAFSSPFDVSPPANEKLLLAKSNSGGAKLQQQQPGRLQAQNILTLPVDTYVSSNSVPCDGLTNMCTLRLTFLDLDSMAEEAGARYCLGFSVIDSAVLYNQAIRSAASSATTTSSVANSGSNIPGESPWQQCEIKILDPLTNKIIGTAALGLQFVVDSIADPVISAFSSLKNTNTGESKTLELERSRNELGLKQAFLAADSDNSGAVSGSELLALIKQSGVATKSKTKSSTLATTSTPCGMEDVTRLLLSLAKGFGGNIDLSNEANLEAAVREVFNRLDVDGDGSVSWWEWKVILTSSTLPSGRNNSLTKFIDPMDPLVIGIQAAHEALKVHVPSRGDNAMGKTVIPYVRLNKSSLADLSSELLEEATDLTNLDTLPPAKAVPRLQNMVKSLRTNNNVLMQRLEKALAASQALLKSTDQPQAPGASNEQEGNTASIETYKSEAEIAKRRLRDSESQFQLTRESYEAERFRVHQLEAELARLKSISAATNEGRSEKDVSKKQISAVLQDEIHKHAAKLTDIQAQRKKRMHATVLLAMFFKKWVIPSFRKRREESKRALLQHKLTGAVARKKYTQTQKKRQTSAAKIGAGVRGRIVRKQVKQMNNAATNVQKIFRGHMARSLRQKLLLQKVTEAFSTQYRAASIIQRCLQKWIQFIYARRQAAAIAIQKVGRRKISSRKVEEKKKERANKMSELEQKKEAERKLEMERLALIELQKMEEDRKHEAAALIQSVARGKLDRAKAAEERAFKAQLDKFDAVEPYLVPLSFLMRPSLVQSTGYWIQFTFDVPCLGNIESFDELRRVLQVKFREKGPRPGVGGRLFIKEIPYDHPKVTWFDKSTHALDPADEDNKSIDLEEILRPELEDAEGYFVSFDKDGQSGNGATRVGHIRYVDVAKRILSVYFLDQAINEEPERVPYDHPNLLWFSQNFSSTLNARSKVIRPPLDEAIGFTVAVPASNNGGTVGDYFTGIISSINPRAETVRIRFEAPEGEVADVEEFPYLSADIVWIAPPKVRRNAVPAPPLSYNAIGYHVEVPAIGEGFEEGDFFAGVVVSVDEEVRMMRLRFENNGNASGKDNANSKKVGGVKGDNGSIAGGGAVSGKSKQHVDNANKVIEEASPEEEVVADDDEEDISYDMKGLVWIGRPSRPSLRDAKGWTIVVDPEKETGKNNNNSNNNKNNVEGVADGVDQGKSARAGIVASINLATQEVRLRYEATKPGEDCKFEVLPYKSPSIQWLHPPSNRSLIARPPLNDTRGYTVEVRSDLPDADEEDCFVGIVAAINHKRREICIRFEAINGEKPDLEWMRFSHPNITWISPPKAASLRSKVPRPKIQNSVGYSVELPSKDEGAEEGDRFVGTIVAFDEAKQCVSVKFETTESEDSDENPDIEVIDYNAQDLIWMGVPKRHKRPPICESVGWTVQLWEEEDAEMYQGKVTGFNEKKKLIDVQFADAALHEVDSESIPYLHPDIIWIPPTKERQPLQVLNAHPPAVKVKSGGGGVGSPRASGFSPRAAGASGQGIKAFVGRPQLEDSVGYIIQITDDDGDVHVGTVGAYDVKRKSIIVLFNDGDEKDVEELPYKSSDIKWISR